MSSIIWQSYHIEPGEPAQHFSLAELHIWLKRKNDEVWIAHEYDPAEEALDIAVEERDKSEIKWSRWALKSADQELNIMPVFPDRPIIVNSEYPLKISPESEIQIFTRVPAWIQISIGKNRHVLTELPARKMSQTWFGNPLEGELCYWLSTKARRSFTKLEDRSAYINCPIRIKNKTHEDLNFEKFCFRVDRLSVFKANEDLWADETHIEYHGEEQNSDITMTGRLPKNISDGEQLSRPRNPLSKSFATRTFKKLFDDTFISAK